MIYRSIWNFLPGKLPVKLALAMSILGLVIAALFTVIFPWIDLSFFAPPTVEG